MHQAKVILKTGRCFFLTHFHTVSLLLFLDALSYCVSLAIWDPLNKPIVELLPFFTTFGAKA